MKAEAVTLARHRLQRARETLHEGDLLREAKAQDGAVNRYYYAAFYAARALLATLEIDSPKHSGVIALFNRHFVKAQVVATDVARVLVRSFESGCKATMRTSHGPRQKIWTVLPWTSAPSSMPVRAFCTPRRPLNKPE